MNTLDRFQHKKRGIGAQAAFVAACTLFVLVIGCGGSGTKATGTTTATASATGTATASGTATATGTASGTATAGTATATGTATGTATATGTSTSTSTSTATGGTGSTSGGIAPHYHITAIPSLAGHSTMYPTAINASGQVVGFAGNSSNSSTAAVLWNQTTSTLTDISGGMWDKAVGINNNGLVIGNAYDPNTGAVTGPVYWNAGSTSPTSATVGSLTRTSFAGLNNSGEIVGVGSGAGFVVNVGSLSNPTTVNGSLTALGINDQHQIVGSMVVQPGHNGPAYWSSASASPALMANVAYYNNSATAINSSGQIVGIDGLTADFWASATGAEVNLGFGSIGGINSAGTVVGSGQVQGVSGTFAIIYTPKAGVVNLNTLLDSASVTAGWTLISATAINDSGWIVGTASMGLNFFTFIAQPLTS